MKHSLITTTGKKTSTIDLPGEIFAAKVNRTLLSRYVKVYLSRQRSAGAKTKTRGQVTGSTRKIYRQKGTGRARHGARKAPIFVGGGVAHGPRPVKRELTLSKRMARKALAVSLTAKAKKGQIVAVDGLEKAKKTGELQALMDKIGGTRFTFILAEANLAGAKFVKNLKSAESTPYKDLNAFMVYHGGTLILDKAIFKK